jgi:hypothetical protein
VEVAVVLSVVLVEQMALEHQQAQPIAVQAVEVLVL